MSNSRTTAATEAEPTCTDPSSPIPSSAPCGGACVTRRFHRFFFVFARTSERAAAISSSDSSNNVLNGVVFDPPRPVIVIFPRSILFLCREIASEASITCTISFGSQLPGMTKVGAGISSSAGITPSSGPKSVRSPPIRT